MRPQSSFLAAIALGLFLSLLGGCGGPTGSKPGSAHETDTTKETQPKPPKPDPG